MLRLIDFFFLRYSWMLAFILGCYICYENGMRKREGDFHMLRSQFEALEIEKQKALAKHEDLLLQVNSQQDPAWIELTLMKSLGLVQEGQIKFLFIDSKEANAP